MTGRDWFRLSTGFDEFRPVFTGFLLVSTRFDWFRLVGTVESS